MSKPTAIVPAALAKLIAQTENTISGAAIVVLSCFIPLLYAEAGFSDVSIDDIKSASGLNPLQTANALFELEEAQIIWISEAEYWFGKEEIPALIYLADKHYDLHPSEYWVADTPSAQAIAS